MNTIYELQVVKLMNKKNISNYYCYCNSKIHTYSNLFNSRCIYVYVEKRFTESMKIYNTSYQYRAKTGNNKITNNKSLKVIIK